MGIPHSLNLGIICIIILKVLYYHFKGSENDNTYDTKVE